MIKQENMSSFNSFHAVPIQSTKYVPLHYNYDTIITIFLADVQEMWKPIWHSSFRTLS